MKHTNSDYLWDTSGEPDPEIQRLEAKLSAFRHNRPVPEFPAIRKLLPLRPRFFFPLPLHRLAAVAILAFTVIGAGLVLRQPVVPLVPRAGWDVTHNEGATIVGANSIRSGHSGATLEVGQSLVTSKDSRASLSVANIGQVDLEPDTHVRLVESGAGRKRIALVRGTIHAAIWAPPGEFVVDTPSAVAVDLGCAYTLQVDESGGGTIRTMLGWVGFQQGAHESFIPAGAMCVMRPKTGPGTPYFEDASEGFRSSLYEMDFGTESGAAREARLSIVLKQARERDALSLWHLLSRVSDEERKRVYERLAALVPPPEGVTREGILQLDSKMLDAWWNRFDLGDISLWRFWKQDSPPSRKAAD
jgi:hypothetical protein